MHSQGENSAMMKAVIVCLPLALILLSRNMALKTTRRGSEFGERRLQGPTKLGVEQDVFEVFVAPSDRFKFNAAHFIAYKGFRERLHGHNYSVSITLIGRCGQLGSDGYLLDFGDVKDIVG